MAACDSYLHDWKDVCSVIHILDAVASPFIKKPGCSVDSSIYSLHRAAPPGWKCMDFGLRLFLFFGWCWSTFLPASPRLSNTSIMKPQLISAISCPKLGDSSHGVQNSVVWATGFFEMGIYPIFATFLAPGFCFFLIQWVHLMSLHSFPTATTTMTRSCIPWGPMRLWPMVLCCRSSARLWR